MLDQAILLGKTSLGPSAGLEYWGPAAFVGLLEMDALTAAVFDGPMSADTEARVRIVIPDDPLPPPPSLPPALPRVERGVRLSGSITLRADCRIESGAILEDVDLTSCWVAGEVRRSTLVATLVAPDERVLDHVPEIRTGELGRILAAPQHPITGAYLHGELAPEDRAGILRYYLKNPGGVRALLEPLSARADGGAEATEAAFARVRRLCQHPVFERLSSESFYAFVFGLVRRGLADAPQGFSEDPYAVFKARFRPALEAHVRARLLRLEAELGRLGIPDPDAEPDTRGLAALMSTIASEITRANLFDGQSESAAAVFGQPGFFEDVAAGLEAAVTEAFAIDHRALLARFLIQASRVEQKGGPADTRGLILYFTDNYEEAWIDATFWALLTALGYQVLAVGKALPARGDATEADLREIVDFVADCSPRIAESFRHRLRLTHNGAGTYGSPPDRMPVELIEAMRSASLIILKGQANTYTTIARNGLVIDAPIVLSMLVKGVTAERVSGIARATADRRHRPLLVMIDRRSTPLRTWAAETGFEGSLMERLAANATATSPEPNSDSMRRPASAPPRNQDRPVEASKEAGRALEDEASEAAAQRLALFLPAAGLGSRLSRLIHKPIVRVDGVNTALALTLNAACADRGIEASSIAVDPITIAVDRSIARRLLRDPASVARWVDGDRLPTRSLDVEACLSLTGRTPEALVLVVSPADGNGAAWLRAMDALERAWDGELPETCLVVNSDFPSLGLPAHAGAAAAVAAAAVAGVDEVKGEQGGRSPEVVVAAKSPMVEDAVVAKGSVRTETLVIDGREVVVPSALVEWSAMSPADREAARALNRRSLETGEPHHFLNTTILSLRIADVRWYMRRIVTPFLFVHDKGKRELHYVPVVELAHRAYQIEDWLRGRPIGAALDAADVLGALGTQPPVDAPEWIESEYLELRARFFDEPLDPEALARLDRLRGWIVDRILFEERVLPPLIEAGVLGVAPSGDAWIRQPEANSSAEQDIARPRTRLVSLGVEAPSGVKDVGRLLQFESDLLDATRAHLRELGVGVDDSTRVRLVVGVGVGVGAGAGTGMGAGAVSDAGAGARTSAGMAKFLSRVLCADDPGSVSLRGDIVLHAGASLHDHSRIDGRKRAVVLAMPARDMTPEALCPDYSGRGMGDAQLRQTWESRVRSSILLLPTDRELWLDIPGLDRLQIHEGAKLMLGIPQDRRPAKDDLREIARGLLTEIFRRGPSGFVDQVHLYGEVFLDEGVRIGGQAIVLKNSWLIGDTYIGSGCGLDGVIAVDARVRGEAPAPDDYRMPDLTKGEAWMQTGAQFVDRYLNGREAAGSDRAVEADGGPDAS